MRPILRLLLPHNSTTKFPPHALTITLFTRTNCSLCHVARDVLGKVWEKKHFEYQEVDIFQGRKLTEEGGGLASKWAVYTIYKLPLRAHSSSAFGSEDISICRNLMFQCILHPPAAGLIADNKPQAKTLLRGTTMEAVNLKKLMHRFTIEEVLRAMQEVEHEVGVGVGPDT